MFEKFTSFGWTVFFLPAASTSSCNKLESAFASHRGRRCATITLPAPPTLATPWFSIPLFVTVYMHALHVFCDHPCIHQSIRFAQLLSTVRVAASSATELSCWHLPHCPVGGTVHQA